MKIICLIAIILMLASLVSASSSERITVSVFVKEKTPEIKTNSFGNYLTSTYNSIYYNYKTLIVSFIDLVN
ncbi:hypothetical protein HYW74_02385 [Candidatus Pacearchaeota archaeon]|nr:hypothetical protein [Candidatus Pacearchaeota archaeon]